MILKTIRSYMVSLGYKVDQPSYSEAKRSLNEMENVVSKFSGTSIFKFAAAGAAVTAFVSTAVGALYKFTFGVADAELQNEMFARKMWMSNDAALSYKNSLDALGVSMQDLYLSPELMNKFIELRKQAASMELPGNSLENSMKGIRSVTFEFQRLKLEASYATYWIGYYLSKYLADPIFGIKGGLSGINDWITQNMPHWTNKVAQIISWFARMGNAAYLTGKTIKELWEGLDKATKTVASATIGLIALLKMGPIGWFIAGLTTLLLLVDDFATYERGGKSAFPKLWEWVDKTKKSMQDSGQIQEFKDNLGDISKNILDIVTNIKDLFGYWDKDKSKNGMIEFLKELNKLLESIAGFLHRINYELSLDSINKEFAVIPKDQQAPNNGYQEHQGEGFWDKVRRWYLNSSGIGNWLGNSGGSSPFYFGPNPNQNVSYRTTISPTYHIYSAADAKTVANTVDKKNTGLIARAQRGTVMA